MNDKIDKLANQFTRKYIDVLSGLKSSGSRTYGFEYEFLPSRILLLDDMNLVYRLLTEIGFSFNGETYQADNGFRVAFEPGGQIEYCSPPLAANEEERLDDLLTFIEQTNGTIRNCLGIDYVGTDFISDRAKAPLCLTSDRYIKLHERLSRVDTRGLEMMKGTASIHLHVRISDFDEILPSFYVLCQLSTRDGFKMSEARKDIWSHTDACRCGTPPCCFEQLESAELLIKRLIHFALHADVLGENIPFADSADLSFSAFLNHMTTLFTDVRFNLKGPTLELRTMDSMPLEQFRTRWHEFVNLLENI